MDYRVKDGKAWRRALLFAGALLAAPGVSAQQSESPPPAARIGDFRLPPANDGRTPGVQGPANNGLPPKGPADRQTQPVRPPQITPAPPPIVEAPQRSAPEAAIAEPTPRPSARKISDRRPTESVSQPQPDAAPAPLAVEPDSTIADDNRVEADPSLPPTARPIAPRAVHDASPIPAPLLWAGALLLLLGAGFWWQRRSRAAFAAGNDGELVAGEPAPVPTPRQPVAAKREPASTLPPDRPDRGAAPLVTRVAAEQRAELSMALEIVKLAMTPNHLEVGFALHLTNRGTAAATGGMARIALQQAAAGQDAQLGRFFDGAGGSLVRDDFEIGVGASETISGEAQLPRERIQPLDIAGKPALVPVLAFDVTYHWDGPADAFGQVAKAFVVGRETVGEDSKIGPLRLDQRSYVVVHAGARVTAMQRSA